MGEANDAFIEDASGPRDAVIRRLATRIGGQRANVALQHDILTAVWHMLKGDQPYRDPGGDYYDRKDPDTTRRHAVAQLRRLGHQVELSRTT